MSDVTARNFGLLIAYVLPGFVVLSRLSESSPVVQSWLTSPVTNAPTVGGFLYVTMASVAAGMTVSALRWLILDSLHHHTSVPKPRWDFGRLRENLAAFEGAVENHYRFYQAYGNMLFAILIAATGDRPLFGLLPEQRGLAWGVIGALVLLFYLASRDALNKYYTRASDFLRVRPVGKGSYHDERMAYQKGEEGPKLQEDEEEPGEGSEGFSGPGRDSRRIR